MPRFMLTLKADENAPFGEPPPELFEEIESWPSTGAARVSWWTRPVWHRPL